MRTDRAGAMTDETRRSRDFSRLTRVLLSAVALAAVTLAGCQHDAELDPFVGPSELSLSLTLSASPDVLALDGVSQSLLSILARDGAGQVLANVTLRLQIRFGGVLQDFGQLSARTLVTGSDGRALTTYTAPLTGAVDAEAEVDIEVMPVGANYAGAVPRMLTIRLVPRGVVIPPFVIGAGFRFTPSSPSGFQEVLFQTNCLSVNDTNCVTNPTSVATYSWDFGDGATGSGPTATHAYATQSTFTAVLTVTDALDHSTSASRSVTVGSTVSYDWDFGDGTTASGVTVSHAYDVELTYSVTLTGTDDRGASAFTPSGVRVASSRPTASSVFSPTSPTTTTAAQFNASASTATSGRTIVSYGLGLRRR